MPITETLASKIAGEDRVRARTDPEINRKIDRDLERRLRFYAPQDEDTLRERLQELDQEWDIERLLETNAASLSLLGIFFSFTFGRKWLLLPLVVSGFLLQHAVQGWCPPVPVLRRMGVRTRLEIEQERYALKLLRGDFDKVAGREHAEKRDVGEVVQGIRG